MRPLRFLVLTAAAWLLAGCAGTTGAAEKAAHDRVARVGDELRPRGAKPDLPVLRPEASLSEFIRYAVLNHPGVAAAYYDWRAAVESIAPARSLPDPQFTFQADIADTLMSFMPGLMFDFMTPGKRAAMGREAAAASGTAYRAYVAAVLDTAAAARKAWIDLAYLDETRRLREASLAVLDEALGLAASDYATGRGMATLENQVRLGNDAARVRTELAALADRRTAARARFKAALGLGPADADPAWPTAALTATALPTEDELWQRAQTANPELGRMQAMVEMASAGVEVARKSGTPDFALGVMADLKADPLMFRPTASLTLPVWRDRIAAAIAAAEARREAAAARVSAEQLALAAGLAQSLYLVREADRMIAFLEGTALPSLDRTLATSEVGYRTGMTGPAAIPETRLMALAVRLERAAALREREIAVTDLLLLTADVAPRGTAPFTESTPNR